MANTHAKSSGKKRSKHKKTPSSKKFVYSLVGILMMICIVLGIYFVSGGEEQIQKSIHPLGYSEIVEREAQNYHIDPLLVYSVIKAESNFDADAVSNAGAMGLMQIMPETYEWLASKEGITDVSLEDLLNPEINIKYGCMFLSILLERYPQLSSAVAAYNAGFGNVDNWLEDITIAPDGEHLEHIPFPETEQYTEKVLKNYRQYQRLYEEFNSQSANV